MREYTLRGKDKYGSGHFQAGRSNRLHDGIDIVNTPGNFVTAVSLGEVTKIGYPYSQGSPPSHYKDWKEEQFYEKKKYRYIEVTDIRGLRVRYFYVDPMVHVGDAIHVGTALGKAQDMNNAYPGITAHFHFEVLVMVKNNKVFLNPVQYLKALGVECREH